MENKESYNVEVVNKKTKETKTLEVKGVFIEIGSQPADCFANGLVKFNEKKEIEINKNLGGWKIENKNIIEIKGLKNYTLEGNKRIIKGVPKKAKFIGFDKNGSEIFEFEKYAKTHSGLREIMGRKTGENFTERKIILNKYDKRIVLKDGETKTIKL